MPGRRKPIDPKNLPRFYFKPTHALLHVFDQIQALDDTLYNANLSDRHVLLPSIQRGLTVLLDSYKAVLAARHQEHGHHRIESPT